MARTSRIVALTMTLLVAGAACLWPAQRKKKTEEELTQTLEVLKDPPPVVVADTSRLVFSVSPLSSKGLLSQQVRDGLKWLIRQSRGAGIVKLRAFVVGSGDVRRVQTIVSEVFTDRRLPLPALSVVQAGDLGMEGAQVVLEAVAAARKPVNPAGLVLISGQPVRIREPELRVAPLVKESLRRVRVVVEAAGSNAQDVVRLTCFVSSMEDALDGRRAMREAFPAAVHNYVQLRRAYTPGLAECEGVARMRTPVGADLRFLNPPGLEASPGYSQAALVAAPRVALSGAQLAFRYQDSDVRLAFERLGRTLEEARTSFRHVAQANIYPLSGLITEKIRHQSRDFFDQERPPAGTMVEFEGLPSLDASFALDVVAVMPR